MSGDAIAKRNLKMKTVNIVVTNRYSVNSIEQETISREKRDKIDRVYIGI